MYFRRSHWSLAFLLLMAISISSTAQTTSAVWSEWEPMHPDGEEFTVLMPKSPTTETEKFPYHKMELTGRLYLSSLPNGPVVAVASINGIKSNPAMYSDFERFNSYVDAFKTWFPAKIRKDAVSKLILVSNKPFHGYSGRVYKLSIGELNGAVHAYATKKRFYAIVALNTKKDDALEEKFLTSFVLPDRPMAQPAVATAETAENANNTTPNPRQQRVTEQRKPAAQTEGAVPQGGAQEDNPEAGATAAPANNQQPPTQPNQKRAPIAGGMLNSKAIYLPLPEVPANEATGVVMVQILIDEQGTVVEARAISGPPHLHGAAINAARLARFTPTTLMGEPVRVTGTLSYNFARAN